jgi:DNA-binding MarR family transcriptional regulator
MVMRAHRNAVAARLAEIGLHVGQEMLLLRLWDADGRSQVDLARDMGVEPPTVAKAVGRLERAGLLERRPDPADRRVTRIWLTEAGRALREPVARRWAEVEEMMFAEVGDAEIGQLREVVRRMARNLSGNDRGFAPKC